MKKIISLLSLLLLLVTLPGCLDTLNGLLPEGTKDFFNNLYLQYEQSTGGEEEPVFVDDQTSYGYYYDQLSDNSQAVYRSIYLQNQCCDGIPIVFRQPLSFFVTASETESADDMVRSGISRIVQPALDAMLYDHPEIDWISMDAETGSTFRISSRKETDEDGNTTVTIKKLTFQLCYKNGLTQESIAESQAAMQETILLAGSTLSGEESRYDTLSALQDFLCSRVVYTSDAAHAHDAAGALIDGAAVCDGYAKAFKLLCDAYEIPCLIVAGTATQSSQEAPHAWNYVQMENGKWYAIDPTWNDGSEEVDDTYFLVGAGTVTSLSLGHFENSHHPNGKFSAGDYPPFEFPELSFFRYSEPLLPGGWIREAEKV